MRKKGRVYWRRRCPK